MVLSGHEKDVLVGLIQFEIEKAQKEKDDLSGMYIETLIQILHKIQCVQS